MRVFIAAIGGSDVYLNVSDTLEPCYISLGGKDAALARAWLHAPEPGVRHLTQSIVTKLDKGEDLGGRLNFPLFESVLRRFPVQDNDSAILLATDQADPGQRVSDTIYSAELCARALQQRGIRRMACAPMRTNPSLHDHGWTYVEACLKGLQVPADAEVVVVVSGGTPALTSALVSLIIAQRGPKARVLQVNRPSEDVGRRGGFGKVDEIVTWPLRRTGILRTAMRLVERYDYAGVQIVLDDEEMQDARLTALLKHGHARLNLCFEEAKQIADQFAIEPPFDDLRATAADAWSPQRLSDIAYAADVSFQRQDYAGFIGRAALLRETFGRYVVFALHDVQIEEVVDVSKFQNVKVKKVLEAENGSPPSIRTFRRALQVSRTGLTKNATKRALAVYEALDDYSKLRNALWHHAAGSLLPAIEEKFGPNPDQQVLEKARQMIEILNTIAARRGKATSNPQHPYPIINHSIRQRLAQYAGPIY